MKRLICAVTVLAVSTAGADTIHVDDDNCPGPGSGSERDPYCSIQTAIDNAVDTDEIVVAPGTYFDTINFVGKAITLQSSGGPEVTTIDAQQTGTVVTCDSGEGADTVLDGFTITGGTGTGPGAITVGGGMYNRDASSPTVTNCTFSGNTARRGGGMYNQDGSSPTVTNCTFIGSRSSFGGGGMFNAESSPTVNGCTFTGNSATFGSGMFNDHSSPTVTHCTFEGNSVNQGGGMLNQTGSSPTVISCTFSGNNGSGNGGGMLNTDTGTSPTVINCTFSGNSIRGGGGGIFNTGSSSPTVINCTFAGNTAGFGGGGMLSSFECSPTVTNCILWGDIVGEIADFEGSVTTVSYSNVQGGWQGTGNINADPVFVDPDNGDFRLQPGSPCIDAGDNTAVPKGTTTDLDGNPRFVDDTATIDTGNGDPPLVDMGVYEFQGRSCPWDCGDNDGDVGIIDFLVLLAQWGGPGPCDFDGGGVGINDFLALLANWGPCP